MKTIATTCALALALAACSEAPTSESTSQNEAEIRTCARGATVEGIDVSTYEGTIDWAAVKSAGKGFAFARVSDGVNYPDATFARNWSQAKAYGIVRGAYQFFRVGQDPVAQADLLLSKIGTLEPGDLPPVLDLEVGDGYASSTIVANAKAWLDRVEKATGKKPIVYTASGFFNDLSGTGVFSAYPLWVANYGVSCPSMPSAWSDWRFFQYSESGSVSGISGNVDLSVWNGTLAELKAFANGGSSAPAGLAAIEVYWARNADGSYALRALPPKNVAKVDYAVDGYDIGHATTSDGANFPATYTFSQEGTSRHFEARGYDANGTEVAHGIGLVDVTADTAVYVKEMGSSLYEIGLERAPSEVTAIEVRADGVLLTDAVEKTSHVTRLGVRSSFNTLGARTFVVTTFGANGAARGTLTRTLTLE